MKKLLSTLLITLSWIPVSYGQDTASHPWYRVDLLIFTQPGNHLEDEAWDTRVFPQYSPNAVDLDHSGQHLDFMDVSTKVDLPIATSQMSQRGYEVVYRRSWNQMMLPKAQAKPIRIKGGQPISGGNYQLDGEITIDIARYLHFRTNLYYSTPVTLNWLTAHSTVIDVPESTEESHGAGYPETAAGFDQERQPTASYQPQYLTVNMQQSRRMRRDELHYLDHPFLGIAVRMTKLDRDEAIQPDTPITQPPQTLQSELDKNATTASIDLPITTQIETARQ